ncbi:MAG TPA: TraR/DksA family transcriptional regulator [Acidimicrobiales bacterium]
MAATQKKTSTTARTSTAKKPAATAAKKPAAKATPAAKKPLAKAPAAKATTSKKPAVRGTTKKPAARKSPFTPAFIAKQKALLEEERAKFLRQAIDKQQEADQLVADRDPGDVQFDEESGEGDSIAVERSLDLALSAQAQDAVQQIDDALARIQNGTYGISVISGEPIPKARLEFIPWAAERVEEKVAKLGS